MLCAIILVKIMCFCRQIKVFSINVAGKSVYDETPPRPGEADDVFEFEQVYGEYLQVLQQLTLAF